MPKKKQKKDEKFKSKPASSPQARENRMIAMAYDLAEEKLRDGTASSQIIAHFLKLGSSSERLDQEEQQAKIKMMDAKTETLQASKHTEELVAEAIDAMKLYSGRTDDTGEDF